MDDVDKLAELAEKMKAIEQGLGKRATREETLEAFIQALTKEAEDDE
ncbi:hypothetical protein F4560_004443 [Saccharothrix ecbatanensis]|uniref:Uncharacterized protein n=1 Tax=Saccharothrix ecbatanensis TaxID=1105145 RepID=A0A7W9HLZ4_9PSEU|nr:hypothetical protein [Saccharothrix ecbatanensis]MBB5804675.1 hypothetical protein [Saccharothrix ecbatanensis]